MPMLFDRFRTASLASKLPLFQKLFENPQAALIGDAEVIKRLEVLVNHDPTYELPAGYTKVLTQKIEQADELDSQKIAAGILNEIFVAALGIPIVDSRLEGRKYWVVRPDIFEK
jgi:hypothetical protein